jgi:molecular chaperone GrpE (heat shock protein)
MITFDQTLDSVERILEQLKSVAELESMIDHLKDNLNDFSDMLEYAHQREFKSTEEALEYIDKILLPRLQGIIDALESGTADPMRQLTTATEHTQRLLANLELVTGESADNFTP